MTSDMLTRTGVGGVIYGFMCQCCAPTSTADSSSSEEGATTTKTRTEDAPAPGAMEPACPAKEMPIVGPRRSRSPSTQHQHQQPNVVVGQHYHIADPDEQMADPHVFTADFVQQTRCRVQIRESEAVLAFIQTRDALDRTQAALVTQQTQLQKAQNERSQLDAHLQTVIGNLHQLTAEWNAMHSYSQQEMQSLQGMIKELTDWKSGAIQREETFKAYVAAIHTHATSLETDLQLTRSSAAAQVKQAEDIVQQKDSYINQMYTFGTSLQKERDSLKQQVDEIQARLCSRDETLREKEKILARLTENLTANSKTQSEAEAVKLQLQNNVLDLEEKLRQSRDTSTELARQLTICKPAPDSPIRPPLTIEGEDDKISAASFRLYEKQSNEFIAKLEAEITQLKSEHATKDERI